VKVSVVVISKDEAQGLIETLAAVTADAAADEVVVVDASEGRLDEISGQFPEVRWVTFSPRPDVRVTIPHQRNRGVAEAVGDVIVFTDCGCIPEPEWLPRLLAPILEEHEAVTCGRTKARGPSVYGGDPPGRRSLYLEECPTINMAFRREVFDAVGGFDESFQYGSDIDFSWRLRKTGVRIRYVADAVVAHDWGDDRRQAKRAFAYGRARARLYRKHLSRLPRIVVDDPIAAAYPLFILGLPLTLKWKAYPLLLAVPLWRNRKQRPVRVLADHLCQGVGVLDELTRVGRAG